jgi:hypothetical protein
MIIKYYSILMLAFFVAGTNLLARGKVRVEASFEPTTITLSNTSTYKIIIHGSQQVTGVSFPPVDGLNFSSPPRTLRSTSFVNGVPSVRFELTFTVTPEKTGTYTVPAWEVRVENETYKVPSAQLQALPPSQKDKLRQAEQSQQQEDLRQAAFMEFSSPRPFLYKGETVEAQVSLYLWDRLPVTRIDQVPSKNVDSVSVTELGQPIEQRNVKRFNKTYSVYTWVFGLTGAIVGTHKIHFESSIRVRVRNNRNSPFNNPFFNDPFFGFGREQGLQVLSNSLDLEVKSLPQANRPDFFQGAIGNLKIETSPDTDHVTVGDPIRFTCSISGTGNFDAMPAPILALGEDFKSGPPAFSFEGNEKTKQQGAQIFEYIVTPLKAGILEIPPVSFSYFNPELEEYYSIKSESHQIRVDPGEEWVQPAVNSSIDATKQILPLHTQDLFQTESDPGEWKPTLALSEPRYSYWFWLFQAFSFILAISIGLLRLKKSSSSINLLKQKEKLLSLKIRDALKHKDVAGFYRNLSKSIKLRVGIACHYSNTQALSSSEVIHLLQNSSLSQEIVQEVIQLLNQCDEQEYAGSTSGKENLEVIFDKTQALMKKIK